MQRKRNHCKRKFESINMKKTLLIVLMISAAAVIKAQMVADTVNHNVVVVKDSRIGTLIKKKAEINKKVVSSKTPSKGYRIHVLNTSDRTQALSAKSRLLSMYPEHKTYLMYQAPYFKLRIGNFVDKKAADALRKELARMFPAGVFVIPSEIEVRNNENEKDRDDSR
jgi:SPOR domain